MKPTWPEMGRCRLIVCTGFIYAQGSSQICLSPRFGEIGQQRPGVDENLLFIEGSIARRLTLVKPIRALCFGLLPASRLPPSRRKLAQGRTFRREADFQ
jgi:hypothetical protein